MTVIDRDERTSRSKEYNIGKLNSKSECGTVDP